ncbi:ras gtpase-activating protein [Anaeramoeba ignava]|uniref:Ras gtpase-activating protein n=1 Tax=Anaeramoeba ignava TaxID=1746090 RepID=A0A9Q0RB37_ANAIG|nr:ras gtpase-activating protein [Anaeramoeba ignava]|eukprot:Anaeramoba_ignava/c21207_g2_i1.p1 GENE.c21207_g2_i1~~c21207_g2_i1.p1  ORF type:complete len:1119 (+),score=414.64 c21207_g2_i1:19-3375(+)
MSNFKSETQTKLYRVIYNPDIRVLKTSDSEDLIKLDPFDLLLRWVNFILRKAGQQTEVKNFTDDFQDCIALTNLMSEIQPNLGFMDVYLESAVVSRLETFNNLMKKTTFKANLLTYEDLANKNEESIIRFLTALFIWKPTLKTKTYQEQIKDQIWRPTTNYGYKPQMEDSQDKFSRLSNSPTNPIKNIGKNIQHSFKRQVTSQTQQQTQQQAPVKETRKSRFNGEISKDVEEILSNLRKPSENFDISSILSQVNETKDSDEIHFTSLDEVLQKKEKNEKKQEKVDIQFSTVQEIESFMEDAKTNFQIINNKLSTILSQIAEFYPSKNDSLNGIKENLKLQANLLHSKPSDSFERQSLLHGFFTIVDSFTKVKLDETKKRDIESKISQIDFNIPNEILQTLSQIEKTVLGFPVDFLEAIKALFYHFLFMIIFKKNISTQFIDKIIINKYIPDDINEFKILKIRNGISRCFDKFLIELVDFEKITTLLFQLSVELKISVNIKEIKEIVEDCQKESFGESLRNLIESILDDNGKELVKQQLLKVETKPDHQFNESFSVGKEALNGIFKPKDIRYITIATDSNYCRDALDKIATALFLFLEPLGIILPFIKCAISQEVLRTMSAGSLFRSNDAATKMITKYAMLYGKNYLKEILYDNIKELCDSGLECEVDPNKLMYSESSNDGTEVQVESNVDQKIEANMKNLKFYFHKFLDRVFLSAEQAPPGFKFIAATLRNVIMQRFPDNVTSAIGGFIFLRFICPAIVSPSNFGVINFPLTKSAQRGLLLLSTVIQALSNGITFSSNRKHMQAINEDITGRFMDRSVFMEQLSDDLDVKPEDLKIPFSKLQDTKQEQEIKAPFVNILFLQNKPKGSFTESIFQQNIKSVLQIVGNTIPPFLNEQGMDSINELVSQVMGTLKKIPQTEKAFQTLFVYFKEYKMSPTYKQQKKQEEQIKLAISQRKTKEEPQNAPKITKEAQNQSIQDNQSNNTILNKETNAQDHSESPNQQVPIDDWNEIKSINILKQGNCMHSKNKSGFKKRFIILQSKTLGIFKDQPLYAKSKEPLEIIDIINNTNISQMDTYNKKKNVFILSSLTDSTENAFSFDHKNESFDWFIQIKKNRKQFK